MNWLFTAIGGKDSPRPHPLIASSGKWMSAFVGFYAAVFWTPDVWAALEPSIIDAILARYRDGWATLIYWLLRIAAYPLVFFATMLVLGVAFVSVVLFVMLKLFGGRR